MAYVSTWQEAEANLNESDCCQAVTVHPLFTTGSQRQSTLGAQHIFSCTKLFLSLRIFFLSFDKVLKMDSKDPFPVSI